MEYLEGDEAALKFLFDFDYVDVHAFSPNSPVGVKGVIGVVPLEFVGQSSDAVIFPFHFGAMAVERGPEFEEFGDLDVALQAFEHARWRQHRE